VLPHTTHLTITPVTESVLPALVESLRIAADEVRGMPGVSPADVLAALPDLSALAAAGPLDSETAWAILGQVGLGGGSGLPERQAPLLALIAALPTPLTERLLTELIARTFE